MGTSRRHGLERLDVRVAETEEHARGEGARPPDASSTVYEDTPAGPELGGNLRREKPESLALVGRAEVGNRKRLDRARYRVGIQGGRIRRRLDANLVGAGEADDRIDAVYSNLRPSLFQGLLSTRHAVKPETTGYTAWQLDRSKHGSAYPRKYRNF